MICATTSTTRSAWTRRWPRSRARTSGSVRRARRPTKSGQPGLVLASGRPPLPPQRHVPKAAATMVAARHRAAARRVLRRARRIATAIRPAAVRAPPKVRRGPEDVPALPGEGSVGDLRVDRCRRPYRGSAADRPNPALRHRPPGQLPPRLSP